MYEFTKRTSWNDPLDIELNLYVFLNNNTQSKAQIFSNTFERK